MSRTPRIWALLGHRRGDNNQVLALSEELGIPFETRTLGYNLLRALHGRVLGRSLASLDDISRNWIKPPWPDLIIAIGRRSVPVARWIRRENNGRTKLVHIGNPRINPKLFDLVITTRQYPVPSGDNVLLLPLAMSRYRSLPAPTEAERAWLTSLPRPHLLMAIGGSTKYWTVPASSIQQTARQLALRASRAGGSLIAVPSPRTSPEVVLAVRSALEPEPHCRLVESGDVRFPVLLSDADENFVTGDSVSMLSEAVLTGKPVGMIPIDLTPKGKRTIGRTGTDTPRRDLRRLWSHLQRQGLIGTLDQPANGAAENPATVAAAAVRRLLGDFVV